MKNLSMKGLIRFITKTQISVSFFLPRALVEIVVKWEPLLIYQFVTKTKLFNVYRITL